MQDLSGRIAIALQPSMDVIQRLVQSMAPLRQQGGAAAADAGAPAQGGSAAATQLAATRSAPSEVGRTVSSNPLRRRQ